MFDQSIDQSDCSLDPCSTSAHRDAWVCHVSTGHMRHDRAPCKTRWAGSYLQDLHCVVTRAC